MYLCESELRLFFLQLVDCDCTKVRCVSGALRRPTSVDRKVFSTYAASSKYSHISVNNTTECYGDDVASVVGLLPEALPPSP